MLADVQQNVKAGINSLTTYMKEVARNRITVNNFALHAQDFMYSRLSAYPSLLRLLKITFPDSLHAAGFDSYTS
jgi:hypothetical protein